MFRYISLLLPLFFFTWLCDGYLYAQVVNKKDVVSKRISAPIVIDGKLTEEAWSGAGKATGFTQLTPHPGYSSALATEVSILYDDNAVYIGATLHDPSPDSILKQLTPRDEFEYNNTDAFGVAFDTYSDQQNGFTFVVTAAGVQADAKIKFDNFDYSWNAAWYSKVTITDKGWCVEMKIPYSALRFPKSAIQKWGVNFSRTIRRTREKSFWNPVLPGVNNFLSQAGTVSGLHDIISPVRLAFLPYISTYAENYNGANSKTVNGGVDIKYGINESFTLDLTLVPDFGQTLYDNKVLNLSPVEVRYDERRYFFTEGTDLFNKNDLFYSRRVGGTPVNSSTLTDRLDSNEVVSKNPATTKLYNAAKISGRTSGNLGIGFFNAVSASAFATAVDTLTGATRQIQTAPLTNYNVIVLDQALKNNSYISFVNTNVNRKENSYNADVSALLFRFAGKNNTYVIDGSGDLSQLYYPGKTDVGYRYFMEVARIRGKYLWNLRTQSISDGFNPNDLGYLARNNKIYYGFNQTYNIYKPFWIANSASNSINITYNRVFAPNVFQSFDVYGSHNITFKSFLSSGIYWDATPLASNDYYEPRTPGRFYVYPENYLIGGYISSDYRKKFALDVDVNNLFFAAQGRNTFYCAVSPRYRFSDKLSMVYRTDLTNSNNDVGFVDNVNDSIFLGTRNVYTLTNSVDAAYIFNNTMSLKLNARHYWSQAEYSKYSFLKTDGSLTSSSYTTSHNVNFNSFNVYASFVWQFKPGSEMSVVYQNSIYSSGTNILHNYATDISNTFASPQSNSLSIKIIYYLDYLTLKNTIKKI